ncbi:hypothetical protein [Virgibacillus sp. MSP4-1]|nr:hypothetical protein [Virgibacillus sp. MSP4-1]
MLESLGLLATISSLKFIRKKIVPSTSKRELRKNRNQLLNG